MKRKEQFRIGTGVSSILMIFIVLCLTTFGVLSYSAASADRKLTDKNAVHTAAYYEADAKAQEILMQIDQVLYEVRMSNPEETVYKETVSSLLLAMEEEIELTEKEGAALLQAGYFVTVNEQQKLNVVVDIFSTEYQSRYEIISYRLKLQSP